MPVLRRPSEPAVVIGRVDRPEKHMSVKATTQELVAGEDPEACRALALPPVNLSNCVTLPTKIPFSNTLSMMRN
jgi:hypothetical protein